MRAIRPLFLTLWGQFTGRRATSEPISDMTRLCPIQQGSLLVPNTTLILELWTVSDPSKRASDLCARRRKLPRTSFNIYAYMLWPKQRDDVSPLTGACVSCSTNAVTSGQTLCFSSIPVPPPTATLLAHIPRPDIHHLPGPVAENPPMPAAEATLHRGTQAAAPHCRQEGRSRAGAGRLHEAVAWAVEQAAMGPGNSEAVAAELETPWQTRAGEAGVEVPGMTSAAAPGAGNAGSSSPG